MEKYKVAIEGTSPLLQHRFSEEAQKALKGVGKVRARRNLSPSEKAEMVTYRDSEGKLAQPALHLLCSMRGAATNFQIQGQGKKTFTKLIMPMLEIEPVMIPHNGQDYVVDEQPATVGMGKDVRFRPRLDEWGLEFVIINLDESRIPANMVQDILAEAGMMQGLGDYRPSAPKKSGPFGKFRVTTFETIKEE